ncbi:MAG TPA: 4Fe-4S dicluster domain-containing protein [Syntrophomonadaceae bacterium]|nr:4Fe-4S dicluster domain-containing protein [Syntrophomonadaceae bacterium]
MAKGRVHLEIDRCKACQLCITFCSRNVLGLDEHTINSLGYHPVTAVNPEECNGCAVCAMMCPDLVIEVERE